MRVCRRIIPAVAALFGIAISSASAWPPPSDPIPRELLGLWAKDRNCGSPQARIRVMRHSVRFGHHKPEGTVYIADDDGDGTGHGALHFRREGVVSYFVYDSARDVLILKLQGRRPLNLQGPRDELYQRCH